MRPLAFYQSLTVSIFTGTYMYTTLQQEAVCSAALCSSDSCWMGSIGGKYCLSLPVFAGLLKAVPGFIVFDNALGLVHVCTQHLDKVLFFPRSALYRARTELNLTGYQVLWGPRNNQLLPTVSAFADACRCYISCPNNESVDRRCVCFKDMNADPCQDRVLYRLKLGFWILGPAQASGAGPR